MLAKRTMAILLLAGFCSAPTLPAAEPPANCGDRRDALGTQLTEARLQGDKVRLSKLAERLRALNQDCRGLVALQANQVDVKRASQRANEREARLREALGAGNPRIIELRREELDQARQELEAAKN